MGEAYRLIAAALKVNNRAPDAFINFANVLHALKRDGEALEALERALALRPGDGEIMRLRGNALLSLNRPTEALKSFEAALAANPRHPEALAQPRHRAGRARPARGRLTRLRRGAGAGAVSCRRAL